MQIRNSTIAALAASLVLVASISVPSVASETTTPSYVAVIDAGSGSTRLALYGDDDTLVPREVTKVSTATKGLSTFASNPSLAGPEAITPLLNQLNDYLAAQGIAKADVPVALLATAGMRNVRRDDRAAAQAILDSTRAAIAASGHPIAENKILPAVQEATLAWLDANALAGTLNRTRGNIGIIAIGGASAQVAFRSPATSGAGVHRVAVEGMTIPVVGVSYLGLGGNDARTFMQEANDAGSFCFPNNENGAEPVTYVSSGTRPVSSRTAMFSWKRCAKAYRQVITTIGGMRTAAAQVPPSGLRTLPGFTSANFTGLGSLPFTFDDFDVTNAANSKTALRRSTQATCAGTDAWTKVLARLSGGPITFADTICSTSTYSHEFLFGTEGVGVDPKRFTTDASVFPRLPAWTSGYAITVLDP